MTRAPDPEPPQLADGFDDNPRCTSCGGQAIFAPQTGHLTCRSCGTARDLAYSDRDIPSREMHAFDPKCDEPETAAKAEGNIRTCSGCGGQVVFVGHAISTNCPYCDDPSVARDTEMAYQADALIPFALDRKQAMERAQAWLHTRVAKPKGLQAQSSNARLVGLYAPFWTFETEELVRYVAEEADVHQTNRQTSRSFFRGTITVKCSDILVPASPHVTDEMRDGLSEGFRASLLRGFRPGYVAGFAAERHHETVTEGWHRSEAPRDFVVRTALRARVVSSNPASLLHSSEVQAVRYRRILLPIWMFHYRFGQADYCVMVSGIDGRVLGERPYARWVFFSASLVFTALAMALGMGLGSL